MKWSGDVDLNDGSVQKQYDAQIEKNWPVIRSVKNLTKDLFR